MMKRTLLAIAIPAVLMAGVANAAEIYNKDGNKVDLYGKVVGERSWTFGDAHSNSDGSYARVGIKGETQINSQLTGYAQWEQNFKASSPESAQEKASTTRKAFTGLRYGNLGSLDYGRNTGVVYDAEAATDALVVWGGDSWNNTDNFMTSRGNGMLTYRNRDFFGLVNGLNFALQYQGKNEGRSVAKDNGDGFSTSVSYAIPDTGVEFVLGYANSNRTLQQKADGLGDKAQATAFSVKYDANNIYAAAMYAQTYNLVPINGTFANKTQGFEAVLQYQFDFGLRPSIGYVQSRGSDLTSTIVAPAKADKKADLLKYIEVGTWYYFNKNMNVYAAYQFNLLDKDAYIGADSNDQFTMGITYQF